MTQLALDYTPPPAEPRTWRPPAPALSGPGWSISDHALNPNRPHYHARAIRAAVSLIEQHLGDRLAYEEYLDAAAEDRRPYQHDRALWARKQRLQPGGRR